MLISAVYKKGAIKPLVEVDLKENEKIEIEIKRKRNFENFHGKLELKEEIADEIVEMEAWD